MSRVLCIEDDVDVSTVLQFALKRAGVVDVRVAHSGDRGVDAALEHPPELILCDLMMPGADGITVAGRLRAHPALARVPIVFVTAYGSTAFRDRTPQECGGIGHLTKPFRVQDLGRQLRELLQEAGHLPAPPLDPR